jgi:peptidoglycan L-alanyl-D-glutamate endopeptidase CwlK
VDVGVNVKGKLTWDEDEYDKVANVILELAAKNQVPVVWGGNFKSRKDRPHYELNQKFYP